MKALFISDIHGIGDNLHILDEESFDELYVLGDVFSFYDDDSNIKICEYLKKYYNKIICVLGNNDSEYMFQHYSIPYNKNLIQFNIEDRKIYCTHGDQYNYRYNSFSDENCYLIYGHEHIPYIKQLRNVKYICIGSISRPRYGSECSYLVYDNNEFYLKSVDGKIIDYIK